MIGVSKTMDKAVKEILADPQTGVFQIVLEFNSKDKKNILTVDRLLTDILIEQDFNAKFSDIFMVFFKVTIQQYLLLFKHFQGLTCTILISNASNETVNKSSSPFFQYTYRVVIKNMEDLFKEISANALEDVDGTGASLQYEDTFIDLTVQLVEMELYNIRKHKFNMILTQVTMEDIIYLFAYLLGIGKVFLVPPDNTRRYSQYVISPLKTIFDVFSYLQNKPDGGVYNKGLSYYYSLGILYVYPAFETNLTPYSDAINIYRVPENTYMGIGGLSRKTKVSTNVICNLASKASKIAQLGMEEIGTVFLTQLNSKIIDGQLTITDTEIVVNENSDTFANDVNNGLINNAYTPDFRECNDNKYTLFSELNSYNYEVQHLTVGNIPLFLFKAGSRISYNFDKAALFTTKMGTVTKAVYSFIGDDRKIVKSFSTQASLDIITNMKDGI